MLLPTGWSTRFGDFWLSLDDNLSWPFGGPERKKLLNLSPYYLHFTAHGMFDTGSP